MTLAVMNLMFLMLNLVVVSNIFYSHPDPWGFMIQFDLLIFFKWVETQPPTREVLDLLDMLKFWTCYFSGWDAKNKLLASSWHCNEDK